MKEEGTDLLLVGAPLTPPSLLRRLGRYTAPWQVLREGVFQGAPSNEVIQRAPFWHQRAEGPIRDFPVAHGLPSRAENFGEDLQTPLERFLRELNRYVPLLRGFFQMSLKGVRRAIEEGLGLEIGPEFWVHALYAPNLCHCCPTGSSSLGWR